MGPGDRDVQPGRGAGTPREGATKHAAARRPRPRGRRYPARWRQRPTTTSAELWDPATSSFGPTGSLALARSGHDAFLLPDGRVLVIGGRPDDGIDTAEVWDPATGAFTEVTLPEETGQVLTATLLADGRVFLVGPTAAQVWDPATGAVVRTGRTIPGHVPTGAILLHDGRVLVVGNPVAPDPMSFDEQRLPRLRRRLGPRHQHVLARRIDLASPGRSGDRHPRGRSGPRGGRRRWLASKPSRVRRDESECRRGALGPHLGFIRPHGFDALGALGEPHGNDPAGRPCPGRGQHHGRRRRVAAELYELK